MEVELEVEAVLELRVDVDVSTQGWGSCKLRQQLLRLLKSLIYWSVWHVGAAVVDVFVVAVVISMPAHTAQPTDRRPGRFTLKGTHNNRPCRAGACVGFRFGFGSLLQPLPLPTVISVGVKKYTSWQIAGCLCESTVCCIFSQVINMYTLSLSRSGCRPCALPGRVRVRGPRCVRDRDQGLAASGIAEQLSKQAAFSFLFYQTRFPNSPHLALA